MVLINNFHITGGYPHCTDGGYKPPTFTSWAPQKVGSPPNAGAGHVP